MTVEVCLVRASDFAAKRSSPPTEEELKQPNARRRLLMAYGKWTTASGREVVFNRLYRPIWQRESAKEPWVPADYAEYVRDIVGYGECFYNDWHTENWKTRYASNAMLKLGISLPPER